MIFLFYAPTKSHRNSISQPYTAVYTYRRTGCYDNGYTQGHCHMVHLGVPDL